MHEPLLRSISEMASHSADGIAGPLDRPFAVFGYSMGALVAFELLRPAQSRAASAAEAGETSRYRGRTRRLSDTAKAVNARRHGCLVRGKSKGNALHLNRAVRVGRYRQQRDETDRGGDDACERIHTASTPPLYRALSSLYLSRTRQLARELVCGPPASEQSMVADSGLSSAGAALVAETVRASPVASRGFGMSQSP